MIPRHKRNSLVLILLISFSLLTSSLFSCKCNYLTPLEGFNEAGVVFEGIIKSRRFNLIKIDMTGELWLHDEFVFDISRVWKGDVDEEIAIVQFPGNCSYRIGEVGNSFLVYSPLDSMINRYTTHQCFPSKSSHRAREDYILLPPALSSRVVDRYYQDTPGDIKNRRMRGIFLIGIAQSINFFNFYSMKDFDPYGLGTWVILVLVLFLTILSFIKKKKLKAVIYLLSGLFLLVQYLYWMGYSILLNSFPNFYYSMLH